MSLNLSQFQSAFADALLAPPEAAPGPLAALTAQPAFAVYRNTVMKGCVDALEANFPAVARLVGSDWFRAAAALYIAVQPPDDARLLRYGGGFPDFLAHFEPASELPYLAGVARLDLFWCEAHAAADASPAPADVLATLAPQALGGTLLAPHPSARWHWFDEQPIYSIWSRNRSECAEAVDGEFPWQGEGALLTRSGDAVVWCAASQADCAFLDAVANGALLGDAAVAALEVAADADLADLLARLLRAEALVLPSTATAGDSQ